MDLALKMKYISKKVPRSSMSNYFKDEKISEVLKKMIKLSSIPLKEVESHLAIDSSGFGTSNIQHWSSFKHARAKRMKSWVKCHIVSGVNTNIITAVNITSEFNNDSPQLKELLLKSNEVFDIKEFSGDKAYLSKENLELIDEIGTEPLIPFRKNITLKPTHKRGLIWKKTLRHFLLNQEEFLAKYHKRSNVETTFHMIKSKFGSKVRSRNWIAQSNEVLSKVLCHNITTLIMEMFNLGIKVNLLTK